MSHARRKHRYSTAFRCYKDSVESNSRSLLILPLGKTLYGFPTTLKDRQPAEKSTLTSRDWTDIVRQAVERPNLPLGVVGKMLTKAQLVVHQAQSFAIIAVLLAWLATVMCAVNSLHVPLLRVSRLITECL